MRIAAVPEAIHAIRIGTAHADLVLGGDLVVTAASKVLETVRAVQRAGQAMRGPIQVRLVPSQEEAAPKETAPGEEPLRTSPAA